jgi:hypothetical protein
MTFYDHHLTYERLTHTNRLNSNLDTLPNRVGSHILSALKALGHHVFVYLSSGAAPRVRKITGRDGLSYWMVYDPTSNSSARLTSEAEVISWIESRY